jgi:NADPH-dependent curcumin reductase CurA
VIISGLIDQYNHDVAPPGPNWGVIASRRLTVCGLRVFDHFAMMPAYEQFIAPRLRDGSVAYVEDISEGLEAAPAALARVLTGGNFGKSIIRM